jgi:L-ascorbate metabolism protein UlaG (beta-lactamase superfamily)
MPEKSALTTNPQLTPVPGMESYPGTPLDQKGLYINEEHPFWPNMGDLIKWKMGTNPYKEEKENDTRKLPIHTITSLDVVSDNSITWLGHATFLIQLNGVRMLIDPVLSEPGFFLKRYTELPLDKGELKNIDYILVSHNHRDHCDKDSIELLAKQNPDATWLCGLGLDTLLLKDWTGSSKIQAAGWYQQYLLNGAPLNISYLPTRHWSRRGLSDTNKSLWGAFLIEGNGKKIYFGGDSGYGSHTRKVHELFGEVDYYLAGIGAFAPRWFMAPSHMHPEEAARSANEMKAKNFLPMHFGTFDLADEPMLEPARLIKELKEENGLISNLVIPAIGEVVPV